MKIVKRTTTSLAVLVYPGESFKAHVAPRHGPIVIGLEHQRADETDDGLIVGE